MNKKEAAELIPREPTKAEINPSQLAIALIGPPKWGKTHFFMSNPNAVLLAFEEGHKFQRGYKMIIDKWDASLKEKYRPWKDKEGVSHMTFMQAIDALEQIKRFDFVIIDTTDMAAKMCGDFHCGKKGIEHVSEGGDYGKGYDILLNTPFRQAMLRILKTGRGVGFICHTKVEVAKYSTGERARKEMRLGGGTKYFVESQADLILHGELGKKRSPNRLRDRIMVCEGDSDTLAGNRSDSPLPERYIVDPKKPWDQLARFFKSVKSVEEAETQFRKIMKA